MKGRRNERGKEDRKGEEKKRRKKIRKEGRDEGGNEERGSKREHEGSIERWKAGIKERKDRVGRRKGRKENGMKGVKEG